jgi:DNA-binding beta-propeller fold protein YncE
VDPRTGRVWVPVSGSDLVTAFDQYPDTTRLGPQMRVDTGKGSNPTALAVDPASSQVWAALAGTCQVVVIDGRASTPGIIGRIDLPHSPSGIAVDPSSGRAYVAFATSGRVGVIEPASSGGWQLSSRDIAAGVGPVHMAFDPSRDLLFISNEGPVGATTATGQESLSIVSIQGDSYRTVANLPLSVPLKAVPDRANGLVYVAENGDDKIAVLGLNADGTPTLLARVDSDVAPSPGNNRNPVGIAVLPGSGEVVVSQYGTGGASDDTRHLEVFRPNGNGLTLLRPIRGVDKAVGLSLDPTSGRVWVTEREAGRVSGFQLDSITATRLPPPLPASLPGPFDVSWSPVAVARSFSLAVLIMLLLGAPTPLFNSTLEANLDEVRRRLGIDRLSGPTRATLAFRPFRSAANSWVGFVVYLLLAAILLSLAERGFPGPDGLSILIATAVSLGVVTAVRLLPEREFVARRFGDRGHVRIVAWTMVIAVACVLITRVAGATPAYVYGILGAYAFTVSLRPADRGRLAARGGVALLALALGVWFLRVPFEPSIEHPAQGLGIVLNDVLVKVFVAAVEGIVIGFIPLQFMTGRDLFAWSRWRWALIWGVAMLLFVHVILYAPSDFVPDPDTTPLLTIVGTVTVYGLIAVVFWALLARGKRMRPIKSEEPRAPGPATPPSP